ncbi:unnamed protein product [Phyllotreta striolata]|uniref:Uncharacterized protein n=1 Tax=Phyllotreta striolata TaxID=444603 RepID=A0A9N9XL41_PHYSR|nr:unnamed protein product [Phyllotreta striolata]
MEAEGQLLNKPNDKLRIKAYKRRWWIISVFSYYAGVNALQWIQYCSITPIIVKYYNVSPLAVDWTSTVFMVVYPILVVPASYIIDKKGIRFAVLTGCTGTLLGTAIKIFSIRNDRFWVALAGNAIVSSACVMISSLPPKLASLWFKSSEVSTACSLGMFGTQMGTAIGYILLPLVVHDHPDPEDIGENLRVINWALTIAMVPVTIAAYAYFPNEPPLPPTLVQAELRETKPKFDTKVFFLSMRDLFLNKAFVVNMLAYSVNMAVFSAIGTLQNRIILTFYEGAYEEVGLMGFLLVMSGVCGTLLIGIVLDKTHKYKETSLINYVLSVLSVVAFIFSLKYRVKLFTYISCVLLGLFTSAYILVGFEFSMELTFPLEESTSGGVLFACTQILSAVVTVAMGYVNLWVGPLRALASLAVLLAMGAFVTAFVPNTLKRQEAFRLNKRDGSLRKPSYHGSRPVF